jgi:hypothetical protein
VLRPALGGISHRAFEPIPAVKPKLDSLAFYVGHWPSLALHDREYSTREAGFALGLAPRYPSGCQPTLGDDFVPNVEIRETIVTPDVSGSAVVALQIADVALPADDAEMLLRLTVRLPPYETPVLLAQWQRETLLTVVAELNRIEQSLAQEIRLSPPHGNLSPKVPPRRRP